MQKDILLTKGSPDKEFWDTRYLNNDTGWDLQQVSPPLKSYIDSLENKALRILIPGCGNAYEAEYLLANGFENVTLIDISKVVAARLKTRYDGQPIQIVNDDFFNHKGNYDLILEQTFFCALHPSLRKNYVTKCLSLLDHQGEIAGVLFNKKFTETEPPFVATDEEYKKLFAPLFRIVKYDECNNSITQRLGTEVFFIFGKE